ncbi:MAG: phosphoribosylformylglycinamidine synthase subunit PurL [Candidatus Bathyarchaeia archaeon]|jgi:phosphoribosylformylglycinamidine synthase|nr:phosphoribosylformylglycinamidine synthase subunit PurL [Candidatus Bathyarchaeota archaeon A05DMB-4]MDH7595487.1 phosphoribosylformylglycinamidine synthase subunit PurL [Candidatus Bathyarchaeota archaeon]
MNLYQKRKVPFELFDVNILKANDARLLEISQTMGLALNLNEMKTIKDYFSKLGRNPTDVELQTLGQTWSEHCYHKTFKGTIVTEKGKIESLFKTYIAKVTKELNLSWCISVFEDNAGIIEFDNGYGIAVKVETHNHPSAIEPFGGAATGVGGVIRDVLGVWADPIACMDVLGFGPLDYDYERLPPGVKHPKYIFRGVVAGIGCYGNNMGIPTVNGAIYFDESYTGNVIVYCGCVGLLPLDKFAKNVKPTNIIVLAGGKTGRDGIHGVTFASAELSEKSEEVSRPAVQIANPIEEEKLKRVLIKIRDCGLGSGVTDLGGGGLSSAVGEMAHRFGLGAIVELDKVPLKYSGLAPWEIYISESQERMLLAVSEKNLRQVLAIFAEEDVEATAIGKFTENHQLKLTYQGVKVAQLDIDFMFQPPKIEKKAKHKKPTLSEPSFPEPKNLTTPLQKILSSPNVASKEQVIRTYDHEVKGNTTLKPLQSQHAGPNDAAVIKPLDNSWKGLVISCGMTPAYGKIDSYWMAASAIDEAVRNNIAVGGRRIALLDNFTWGNPEKPERLGALVEACRACYEVAKGLETPFISGKDSLYNESPLGPVTPTLLITAVGIIPDVRKTVSMELKTAGDPVYILGQTGKELGGSEYYRLLGFIGKTVPKVKTNLAKRTFEALTGTIDSGLVRACHDISEGGLAVAAAEMAFSSDFGLELCLKDVPRTNDVGRNDFVLFSESNSRFLVEVSKQHRRRFEELMKNCNYAQIGIVTDDPFLKIYGLNEEKLVSAELAALRKRWQSGLGGA